MAVRRRSFLTWFASSMMLSGFAQHAAVSASNDDKRHIQDRLRTAKEMEAEKVARLFSTAPIRIRVGTAEYLLPRNFLTHKGAAQPDILEYEYLMFVLFLPEFSGYSMSNWQEGWLHQQRIDVLQVSSVDKTATVPYAGGGRRLVQPANYGEPRARFANLKALLELQPSLHQFGLAGYRRKNYPAVRIVTWTGTRSNGEFVFFQSSFAPDESPRKGMLRGHCDVRYYSEKEDRYIVYRYDQRHIAKWRAIDDVIWNKIKQWRLR